VPPDLCGLMRRLQVNLELDAIRPLELAGAVTAADEIDPALFESMQYQGHTWSVPLARITREFFTVPCLRQLGLPDTPDLGGVAAGGSSVDS